MIHFREVEESKVKPFIETNEIFETMEETSYAFAEVKKHFNNASKECINILFESHCPSSSLPILWLCDKQFNPLFVNMESPKANGNRGEKGTDVLKANPSYGDSLRQQIDTIFITYSWDDKEHEERVLSLTSHLRDKGFNAIVDKMIMQEETAVNFTEMMQKELNKASKVIIVVSGGYKKKAEGFKGGVGVEYSIILNDINKNKNKYIIVSFEGINDDFIPMGFGNRYMIDLRSDAGLEALYSKLMDFQSYKMPPVATEKPKLKEVPIPKFNLK